MYTRTKKQQADILMDITTARIDSYETGGSKMSGDGFGTNESSRDESRYDKSRKRKMSPAKY